MKIYQCFLCSVLAFLYLFSSCSASLWEKSDAQPEKTIPILMFHDVKDTEGGTWSISVEHFRSILLYVIQNDYTPVFFEDLVNFVDGKSELPEKPVVITLDDGYFSNYSHVLPVTTELGIPVSIFLCCGMVREEGTVPNTDKNILSKMSLDELKIMQESPYVHIYSHTFALHGTNLSGSSVPRDNVLPLETEDKEAYRKVFTADCVFAEAVLHSVGADLQTAFSYPSGKHHPWTEEILCERGYRVSVTTDCSHRNRIVQGDSSSLLSLGRMNVNDETTEEILKEYLERD